MSTLSKIRGIHKLKTITTSGTEPLERLTVDLDDAYHGMEEPGEKKAQEVKRPVGAGMGTLPPAQMTRKVGATTSVVTVLKPPPLLDETRVVLLACLCAKPDVFADCLTQTVELLKGGGGGSARLQVHFSLVRLLEKHPTPPTLGAIFQSALDQTQYSINPEEAAKELAALKEEMEDVDVEREFPVIRGWMESWLKREKVRAATAFAVTAWTAYEEKPDAETYENLQQRMAKAHEAVLWMNEPLDAFQAVDIAEWLKTEPPKTEPVLEGLLDRNELLMFGSASKARKTWCALHAALCVQAGHRWWNFNTVRGKVVFLNFELSEAQAWHRIKALAKKTGIPVEPGQFLVHNLKGTPFGPEQVVTALTSRYRKQDIALFLIDPMYYMSVGKVENAAEDMLDVMRLLAKLVKETGAAVWVTHHFSKGNQSAKDMLDRFSGSGVQSRFIDTALTLNALEEDDGYRVEAKVRGHVEVADFSVRWDYPLMSVADELDGVPLKQKKAGRSPTYSDEMILKPLLQADNMEMSKECYKDEVIKATGMGPKTFKSRYARLSNAGKLEESDGLVRYLGK